MNYSVEKYTYSNFREDIQIEISPRYVARRSNPLLDYYFFQYDMTIVNHTDETLKLWQKNWVLNRGVNSQDIEHGDGLNHIQLVLRPNSSTEVSSFCSLPQPYGNLRGHLWFTTSHHKVIQLPLPLVFFRPPMQ